MKVARPESFTAKYKPSFDQGGDEWILQVPQDAVRVNTDGSFEVRLPLYASRALALGGNMLRPIRKQYRDWLLTQQQGLCDICGSGARQGDPWNLDHQPTMASLGSKFIDYDRTTKNRVIHQHCDPAQQSRRSPQ